MVQHHRYCDVWLNKPCDCAARKRKFGDVGESLLVAKYRELYWQNNETQIVGADNSTTAFQMEKIVNILGYVPAT